MIGMEPLAEQPLSPMDELAAREIEPLFRQALAMHQRGLIKRATEIYEQILERHPAHFDCCHMLGVAHIQTGHPERAVDLISRALSVNPQSADAHYNLAHALRSLNRADEALSSLNRAISLRPDFAEYHVEQGSLLEGLGRIADALAHFEKATELSPASPDAFMLCAKALSKLNRFEEALKSCDEAVRLRPASARSHRLRGKLLRKLNRLEDSLASFDTAIGLDHKSTDAHRQRARILRHLNRLEESLASYAKVVQLAPDDAEAFVQRANILAKLHRHDEALASYDQAIRLAPDNAELLFQRAATLAKLSRHDEALASIDRAIALNPNSPKSFLERGFILGHLNRMDDALESLDRATSLARNHVPVALARGWLYSIFDRWALARAEYEKALSHDQGSFAAWIGLAELPDGYLTAERASELLGMSVEPEMRNGQAKKFFGNARLLRHLRRYQESFEALRQANELRLAELPPEEWRSDAAGQLRTVENWEPSPLEDDLHGSRPRLLVILGPSRSGKTTLERLLCRDEAFKRGFEGALASRATPCLREIVADVRFSTQISGKEVTQRVFKALFQSSAEDVLAGKHDVVTNTNPFLLRSAHLIHDLYPHSHFIFIERYAVDNAAEIFAQDYTNRFPYAYCPRAALDYVTFYQNASSVLCRKMGSRAVKVSYEDLLTSHGTVLASVHALLGLDPPRNPAPECEARDTRSVYREFFAALCAEQENAAAW